MNSTQKVNSVIETVGWGAIFILWGVTSLFDFLPAGTGAIGLGLIFIGLNAARIWKGIPASKFTLWLGILALVLGAMDMARSLMHLSFELPVFAVMLLAFGTLLLVGVFVQNKTESPNPA
jgi:hypothetical protein